MILPFCSELRLSIAAAALAAAFGGCAAEPEGPERWGMLLDGHPGGLLLSVWGRSPDDVWVVGGRPGRTEVLRGDRGGLSPIDNPGTDTAWWVCGLGEATGVVGAGGLVMIERGDGLERLDLGLEGTLFGCFGAGPDDFWVVGGEPLTGPPQLAHVGPEGAVAPDLGPIVPSLPTALYKVWGAGGQLFVVGLDGALLTRSADGAWQLETVGGGRPLFTVAGTGPEDVWAVGGRAYGLVVHWDGATWSDATPMRSASLTGVWAGRDGTLLACGSTGTIIARRQDDWELVEAPTSLSLHAVWGDGQGGAWAVGGNVEEADPANWRGVVVTR